MARSCDDLSGKAEQKNPFLFSNFIKKGREDGESAKVWNNFDSSNESIDHAPFPDLCLNGLKSKSAGKPKKKKDKKKILKIVDDEIEKLDEKSSSSLQKVTNVDGSSAMDHPSQSSESDDDNADDGSSDSSNISSPLGAAYILPAHEDMTEINNNLQLQIKELEERNDLLMKKLIRVENEAVVEREKNKNRIERLIKEVEATKKKELDETAALESVVHMVEENLRVTTQRALKAEATVSKLKDEMKFLKEDSIPRSKYVQLLEEYEYNMDSIRQKSRDTAKIMRVASSKTEPLIKELLSGVSSLQFFAEQFESIDKIAEINPTRDRVV
eukprot:gene18836-20732_t